MDLPVRISRSTALAAYEAARTSIMEAASVVEAKVLLEQAEDLEALARVAKDRELEAKWSWIRLRAERRLGEIIARQKETVGLATGGQPYQATGSSQELVEKRPTLASVGITKKLSSRSQKLAALPATEFEQYMGKSELACRPTHHRDLLRMQRIEKARNEHEEARKINPGMVIHHCGIDDVSSDVLPDCSVDAVITDPPYPAQFLPLFSSLSRFSERVLKPGGWCVVMTGAVYLPEVIRRLEESLTYRWQYMVTTPGGANVRMSGIGLFQAYKPVLIFQKPPTTKIREWWPDVITARAGEQDKSLHPWQQSEKVFIELVNRFTSPGCLVADPFSGSGTTGRAAVGIGRHFWGCDIDGKCANT